MHERLKVFDFVHTHTADIGVTWPWTIALFFENDLKTSHNILMTFTCSGERLLHFGLLVVS